MVMQTKHRDNARVVPTTMSYDDIEEWMMVYYKGERGFVSEKGQDVVEGVNAEHIKVDIMGETDRPDPVIHKNTVNKYLSERKTLWVDFGHNFVTAEPNDALIRD